MSTYYQTSEPIALADFLAVCAELGWHATDEKWSDEPEAVIISDGESTAPVCQAGDYVGLTRYGSSEVDGLAFHLDMIDEHDLFQEMDEDQDESE